MKRGRKARCLWCGSSRTIAKGVRRTVSLGNRRLRVCKDCGRKFTVGRAPIGPMPAEQMMSVEANAPIEAIAPVEPALSAAQPATIPGTAPDLGTPPWP